ncbi:hypothetical protein CerSpe_171980 [Prunus speciosa]
MEAESQMREVKYDADICSIREAEARIKPFIHQTPVLENESLNALAGRRLFFKCECFQKGLLKCFPHCHAYSFSQLGLLYGILFQLFYGLVGSWTAFLINLLYVNTELEGKEKRLILGTM